MQVISTFLSYIAVLVDKESICNILYARKILMLLFVIELFPSLKLWSFYYNFVFLFDLYIIWKESSKTEVYNFFFLWLINQ